MTGIQKQEFINDPFNDNGWGIAQLNDDHVLGRRSEHFHAFKALATKKDPQAFNLPKTDAGTYTYHGGWKTDAYWAPDGRRILTTQHRKCDDKGLYLTHRPGRRNVRMPKILAVTDTWMLSLRGRRLYLYDMPSLSCLHSRAMLDTQGKELHVWHVAHFQNRVALLTSDGHLRVIRVDMMSCRRLLGPDLLSTTLLVSPHIGLLDMNQHHLCILIAPRTLRVYDLYD